MTSQPVRPRAQGATRPRAQGATRPRAQGATRPRTQGATPPPDTRQDPREGSPVSGGKPAAPLTPGRATPGYQGPDPDHGHDCDDPRPRVWVDQQLCTGDGFCAKVAPEQFRMHWDGLAYVVGPDGELRTGTAQTVPVIPDLVRSVIAAAVKCPGDCIYVLPGADGTVYGKSSPREGPSTTSATGPSGAGDPHPKRSRV